MPEDKKKKDKKEKSIGKYNKSMSEFLVNNPAEELLNINEFGYDPKNYKSKFNYDILGQAALAMYGMSVSDKELPRLEEKVSEATKYYLQESKRIAKMGLPPELEAKAKNDLTESTKLGIENLVRLSGGNRNAILSNLGVLDVNRSKAINDLNIADAKIKQDAFNAYGKTLREVEAFKERQRMINHKMDVNEALRERTEGQQLSNQALGNLMNEIQFQKENAPGSATHMFKNMMEMELFGSVSGLTDEANADPTVPGSQAALAQKVIDQKNLNTKIQKRNDQRTAFIDWESNVTDKQKVEFSTRAPSSLYEGFKTGEFDEVEAPKPDTSYSSMINDPRKAMEIPNREAFKETSWADLITQNNYGN